MAWLKRLGENIRMCGRGDLAWQRSADDNEVAKSYPTGVRKPSVQLLLAVAQPTNRSALR
jgi:hypothetical protein